MSDHHEGSTPREDAGAVPDFCQGTEAKPLRVMWIWHAAVVAEYQKPVAALGRCPDLDMTLLVPRRWP
ncbi:MAG: hypothetical protein M3014_12830, partial [Chloroflexota bacterium]|nr:hypothetical protein [Chloroflexota bacterium]